MGLGSRSVEIFLIANADKWVKGLDRATSSAEEFGRALKNQKKLADMTFKAGAALVVSAAGMIAATVGPATKLEDAVNRVASLTGKTGAEFTALTAGLIADAKRLSVRMGASLDNVTAAYESAVVNGIDPTTDAFKRFVTQALQVSRVTGQDVAANIALADEVLDRFGKKLADSPDALAELYKMSGAAEGGFAPFLQTIGQAGAIAGQLDVPLKEVAATVALMSQQGISGSRAGLALGNMLMRLSGASDNASDSLHKLGIEIIDPATGKVKNLADVFEQLRAVLASMSEQEANKLLTELAGGQGVKALGGLLRNVTGDYRAMFAAMEDGKSLQDAFNERTETTKFQIDQARASIEAARADIGAAYLPMLADVATKIAGATNAMRPFITAHADAILPVTGLAVAVGLLAMGIGKSALLINAMKLAFPALVGMFGPVALVIAGVTAALIATAAASKSFESKIAGMETALSGSEAKAALLRERIAELEKEEKTYFETTGKGNPVLASLRGEFDELTKTIEKQKGKLVELGAAWTQNTVFAIDAALGTIRAKREELEAEMTVGGWEGGEGAPIFAPQIKELEKLALQTERLMDRRKELVAAGDVLAASTADTTAETVTGTGAMKAATEATTDFGKAIAALVAEQKKARLEASWIAPPVSAEAVTPMGPPAPIVPDFGADAIEQMDLVGVKATETGALVQAAFYDAFNQTDSLQMFADDFVSIFDQLVNSGENVGKSFAKALGMALIQTVKMAIRTAMMEILAFKIKELAKAAMGAPLSFGATLAAIGPIMAAAAAGTAALSAIEGKMVKGFYSGGIIDKTGMILAHAGERVINPAVNTTKDVIDMLSGTRLAAAVSPAVSSPVGAGGMAAAPIYFHMPIYGPVSSELDLEKIMRRAADVFRASHGG